MSSFRAGSFMYWTSSNVPVIVGASLQDLASEAGDVG